MPLAPTLRKIQVDPGKLILDPNNPRLFSHEYERTPLKNIMDPGVQDDTRARINILSRTNTSKYKIDDLVRSILSIGYVPESGGYMFVRKLPDTDYYIVLEGNRRLAAIRKILSDKEKHAKKSKDTLKSLSKIEVQEITDEIAEAELEKKISYILGTAHHGSHKSWSPFAQAKEIYFTYTHIAKQDWETFKYDIQIATKTASLLNTDLKQIKERLSVYRAMKQLSTTPEMMAIKPNGGIIDEYYSLIRDAVCATKPELKKYIPCHPDTLLIEQHGIDRLLNLCKFNGKKKRDNSPMNDNRQWRFLNKILEDVERDKNLELVEKHYEKPEEVWATRAAVLHELNWGMWLIQVQAILKDVTIDDDFDSDGARQVINSLEDILNTLGEKQEN